MPRGKYARKNKHLQKQSALTTKLMRINLRMDDHIYNNKPIAASEAARFLQDIESLKLQCLPTNVRALQVIEKLTRLMRNILTEEEPGHSSSSFSKSFQINTEFAGSASPVYSLPDEDKINYIYDPNKMDLSDTTCISDDGTIHEQINTSHGQNKMSAGFGTSASRVYDAFTDDNEIKNTTPRGGISRKEIYNCRAQINLNISNKNGYMTISQPERNMRNTIDNGEVINITNDSDIDEADEVDCNEHHISVEHVNTGISKIVIHDKVGNQTKVDDCSQSILDNYANGNENPTNRKDKLIEKEAYKEKDAKARVINKVNNYFQKQTPLQVIPSQNIFAHAKSANREALKVDFNNSESVNQGTGLLENNKMEKKRKVGNEKDKPKKRITKKNLKQKENNVAHYCLQNDPKATMAFKDVINKSNNNKNRLKPVRKSKKLKKVHELYNENVENDLSWVENLRYVREISPSEYDPAFNMLPENFWDNFELPGTWDDLDFDV